nr:hypothetical protein Iba_chr02dCG10750 [Ipomoea batatas]
MIKGDFHAIAADREISAPVANPLTLQSTPLILPVLLTQKVAGSGFRPTDDFNQAFTISGSSSDLLLKVDVWQLDLPMHAMGFPKVAQLRITCSGDYVARETNFKFEGPAFALRKCNSYRLPPSSWKVGKCIRSLES